MVDHATARGVVACGRIPPKTRGPHIPILRPGEGQRIEALIVSPFVTALWLHWDIIHRCMVPHVEGICDACIEIGKPDWKGYLAVKRPCQPGCELLEISAWGAERCLPIQMMNTDLCGLRIIAERFGKGKRGKIRYDIDLSRPRLKPCYGVDVYSHLGNIFGFAARDLGSAPPPRATKGGEA